MTDRPAPHPLRHLARLYGIQTAYYDVNDRLQSAKPDSLLQALQLLGAPLERIDDAPDALRARRAWLWQRPLEPVAVAWEGELSLPVRTAPDRHRGRFRCRIDLEEGGHVSSDGALEDLPVEKERIVEGSRYIVRRLNIPERLPFGYHRLVLELDPESAECLVFSAPLEAFSREIGAARRRWGVFLPLYALHRESSWGAGDFSDLEAMMQWVSDQGGSLVATLPLLAWLSEVSNDPSPYSPASRLFWNEFYLDVTRIPELSECEEARALVDSTGVQQTLTELRENPHVDYLRQMRLKREVLQRLAEFFFSRESGSRQELEQFRADHPELETYAGFRAVGERQRQIWPLWPERLRNGSIQDADFDPQVVEYHLYTQWQVERQLQSLAEQARRSDMLWYLDFPLGVSGAGYDVWRQREVFGLGASGGAPPDAFFTKGQNWGFPPLDPHRLREQGYAYFIQALRRHLQYARLLRLDHVMSLHRLYWIPDGFDARDGVYVRYRSEEMFAILVLESHRYRAEIVGENLGTVPATVDDALNRHRIRDMFVVQYEANPTPPGREPPLREIPEASVASLNTHDMPPFASYWTGLDVDDRVDLGLLDTEEAETERNRRATLRRVLAKFLRERGLLDEESLDLGWGPTPPQKDVMAGFTCWLASSRANVVLVNLEDLWEETQPQNTPGTFEERVNWRKKLRYSFEEFRELPHVVELLERVNARRTEQISREVVSKPHSEQ